MNRTGMPLIAVAASILMASMAHAGDWKKETTKEGNVSVAYRISQTGNPKDGKPEDENPPLIEYRASMTDSVSFRKCIAVLMDVSKHKDINDDEKSETLKTLSEREWLLYYAMKIPWPLPKSDCVLKMRFEEDTVAHAAVFRFIAAPDLAPTKAAKRMRLHEITYTLKDLGNGKVELSSIGKSSPPFKLPLWMISSSFPKAAADPLRNIAKLAKAAR